MDELENPRPRVPSRDAFPSTERAVVVSEDERQTVRSLRSSVSTRATPAHWGARPTALFVITRVRGPNEDVCGFDGEHRGVVFVARASRAMVPSR